MAEREDLREREETEESLDRSSLSLSDHEVGGPSTEVDLSDLETDAETTSTDTSSSSRLNLGIRSGIRSRMGSLFDTGAFLLGLVLSVVGLLVVGGLLPLGGLGGLVGMGLATFGYGLVSEEAHYLEMAVAGAAVGGAWSLLSNLVLALVGVGAPIIAFGLAGGAVAGALGHYFGRDLRDGLTREV